MVRPEDARTQLRAVLIVYRHERTHRIDGDAVRLSDEDWSALRERCLELLDAVEQSLDGHASEGNLLAQVQAARAEIADG